MIETKMDPNNLIGLDTLLVRNGPWRLNCRELFVLLFNRGMVIGCIEANVFRNVFCNFLAASLSLWPTFSTSELRAFKSSSTVLRTC